eukprot:131644_1
MGCGTSANQHPELIPDTTASGDEEDYRGHIIKAYVYEMRHILRSHYKNTPYGFFIRIPQSVNDLISLYYQHYNIYSVQIKSPSPKVKQLHELERLVYDTNNVFHGDSKLYVKDFANRMHAFVLINKNDKHPTNNAEDFELFETYCFRDFMCVNEIETIKTSLYNEHRKIIKLKSGSIYTQYSKNANGWNQIHKLKKVNIISIDCGMAHSLFLTADGTVLSHGKNDEGQCGIVKTKNGVRVNDTYIGTPTVIDTFVKHNCHIESISCGHGHNVCIDANGRNVWMFGRNKVCQCSPESKAHDHGHEDDEYYVNYSAELYLPTMNKSFIDTNIIKAQCGNDFSVLLSAKGFLYGMGNINGDVHLEIKGMSLLSPKNNIIDFECSSNYVVWTTNKNKVYSSESKQSWWYGWNRHRHFTQDWCGNKPVYWNPEMFGSIRPSKIDKIVVGKHNFILFMN